MTQLLYALLNYAATTAAFVLMVAGGYYILPRWLQKARRPNAR